LRRDSVLGDSLPLRNLAAESSAKNAGKQQTGELVKMQHMYLLFLEKTMEFVRINKNVMPFHVQIAEILRKSSKALDSAGSFAYTKLSEIP